MNILPFDSNGSSCGCGCNTCSEESGELGLILDGPGGQQITFVGTVNASPFTSESTMESSLRQALQANGWGVRSVRCTITGGALTSIVAVRIVIDGLCPSNHPMNYIASAIAGTINSLEWSNQNANVRFDRSTGCSPTPPPLPLPTPTPIPNYNNAPLNVGHLATVTVSASDGQPSEFTKWWDKLKAGDMTAVMITGLIAVLLLRR